ncbi:MAG: TRAP transporter TatT component family protein [Sandaracinaceae bacterium]
MYAPERDAGLRFWAGYSRGRYINARWPSERRRERAFSIALVRRSVELDPTYYGAAGLGLLAYVATMRPAADLDEAERAWARALEASGRRNHLLILTMAQTYAVRLHDRDLQIRLLREVVDREDDYAPLRLSNRLARRRAIRALRALASP